jgi:hypothetical protein
MTTQTVAITLSTSSYIQNANGNTVITTGPAVINAYNSTVVLDFANQQGTLDSTGTVAGNQSSGIFLSIGDVSGQRSTVGNGGGLITGYEYGIFLASHTAVSNPVFVFNTGTITSRATTFAGGTNPDTAGIFAGAGTTTTISNGGLIQGGEGIFLQANDAGVQFVKNDAGATIRGTISENGNFYAVKIQDNNNGLQGTGSVFNAGLVSGLIDIAAKYGSVTNTSTGTITGGLFALGTGTLALEAGGSFAGGATFRDGAGYGTQPLATLMLDAGAAGAIGTLTNPAAYVGFGSVTVQTGADWTVGTAAATAGFSGVTTISDFGTLNVAGSLSGNTIDMEGSLGAASKVDFTGTNTATKIVDYATGDQIVVSTLGGTGDNFKDSYNTATNVLTITEYNAAGTSIGSSQITVSGAAGVNIATSGSFIELSGPGGDTIVLGNTSLSSTSGSIYIDNGESETLSNTTGVDTIPVTFGTHGTLGALNSLVLNGSVSGTTSPYQGAISGFGLNDDIILGPSVLPSVTAGEQVSLAYSGSLLTVTELNSSGVSIGSTTLNVGTGYAANSFVALLGTNGVNIETPATVDEATLTFNATGTANIETPTDYTGGLAPGSSIVAGETVLIASGTASVVSGAPLAIAPTGTIIVSGATSGLIDTGTLGGTGTVDLVNGGHATIGTDLGTINMGGANAGTTLNFSGSSDLSGTTLETTITNFGTLDTIVIGTVDFAATAGNSLATSFNAATGVLTVTDAATGGTINIDIAPAGSTLSALNYNVTETAAGLVVTETPNPTVTIDNGMSYDIAGTVVSTLAVVFGTHGTSLALNTLDLTGTVTGTNNPYQGSISGFGLNDDIILGPSVLPSVASGDVVTLSYAGSLLTVTELNGSGVSIGSTTLNVGTGYSASSFVALLGADGVNIETPQTVVEQTFTFGPEGAGTGYQGSFEDPTQYKGGLAPGSTIVAGETVVVAQPAQANLNSALTNNGLIVLDGINQNMVANSPISGNGTIEVAAGSVLTLDNPTGTTTNTIAFGGGNSFLTLAGTGTMGFAGVIANIGSGDTIDLTPSFLPTPTSASNIGLSFNSATGVLTISDTVGGSVSTDMLTFSGVVPGTFAAAIGAGGIVITDVPCFAAGTRILTPDGQVAVERLAVGDTVLTARDGATQKIIWAGSRTVDLARHAMPEKVIPVVILAGAFGDGLPERDLKLSPDHALFIDGGLIEAKTLVNGTTVIRDKSLRYVTYHHIELERHDVVLAEGLAAETYLDSGNRQNFDSDAAPLMLHPDFAAASRAGACATLLTDGAIVRAARANLLLRAEALGFTRTDAIDLVVTAGAERIEAMGDRSGNELMFVLPAGTRDIALLSATGVPAELSADPSDRRALGAALTGLALIAGGKRIEIALDDPAHQGFYAIEGGHRWTNGEARIALPAYSGRAVLEVTLHGQAARWQAPLSVTA